ncbi:MAG: DUF4339 domain-containing protein [Candidatus Methylacidiphilales bacterium]|nr:DUF4339 domain-containing protein [Candidatus Methylacidiphilales bacterium]
MKQHPALSDPRVIFLVRGNEHTGPYTRAELRRYWALGRMHAHDMVWVDGMSQAVRLTDFLSMRPLAGAKVAV